MLLYLIELLSEVDQILFEYQVRACVVSISKHSDALAILASKIVLDEALGVKIMKRTLGATVAVFILVDSFNERDWRSSIIKV